MSKFDKGEYPVDVKVTRTEFVRGYLTVDDEGNQNVTVFMEEPVEAVGYTVNEVYMGQTPLNRRGDDEYVTGHYEVNLR